MTRQSRQIGALCQVPAVRCQAGRVEALTRSAPLFPKGKSRRTRTHGDGLPAPCVLRQRAQAAALLIPNFCLPKDRRPRGF